MPPAVRATAALKLRCVESCACLDLDACLRDVQTVSAHVARNLWGARRFKVGLKNVRMRDFDGLLHIVPNSLVGNSHIVSVAPENTEKQRALLIVELAATTTDEDLAKFTEVAKTAVEAAKDHHLVTARMRELTPYGFKWEVYFNVDKTIWTADQQSATMIRIVAAVRKSGMRLANEARLAALEQSGPRIAATGADC